MIYFDLCIGTRLRAPTRLIANLRAEDEMQQAEQNGYEFPTNTNETLRLALEALAQQGEEEEEAAAGENQEVEELMEEWDEVYGEEEEELDI